VPFVCWPELADRNLATGCDLGATLERREGKLTVDGFMDLYGRGASAMMLP
jgi:hypothetical protein